MGVVIPRATHSLARSDFRQCVLDTIGDARDVDVLFNDVLVAIYIRPHKIGKLALIERPDENIEEDLWQSKVGLVIKLGPLAFQDDDTTKFHGQKVDVGEWCGFRVGDSWMLDIGGVACRLVADSNVKLKLRDPNCIL